ncbi:MAG: aldehyde dehydrogenase family protein, partial [Atopobiaceae bacterium]|nr:aldehyde dehydrogenase family protein [Atopobiaceae bacterium]
MSESESKARLAHEAAPVVAHLSAQVRSEAIRAAAGALLSSSEAILEANGRDMARAREAGMADSLLDRLMLDEGRVKSIASSMSEVADQPDPLARTLAGSTLPSGVRVERVTVPLGVVAIVYEARPNVTADAIALCLRSGNACVLRGGSAAHDSCIAITEAARAGAVGCGVPPEAIAIIEAPGHDETQCLMRATGLVDLLIPRGGASLIRACVEGATVPTIQTGVGNCHIYLE